MVAATLDRNPSTAQSLLVPEASLDSTIDVGALNVTHLTTAAKSVSVVDVQIEDTQAAGSLRIAKFAVTALLTIGLQVVALAFIFRYIDELSQISALAYPGVMLAEFSNSAMVNLPTPWPAFTLGMAVFLNPFLVGLLGGLAAATGELVGYFLGMCGREHRRRRSFLRTGAEVDRPVRRKSHLRFRGSAGSFRFSRRLGRHSPVPAFQVLPLRGRREDHPHHTISRGIPLRVQLAHELVFIEHSTRNKLTRRNSPDYTPSVDQTSSTIWMEVFPRTWRKHDSRARSSGFRCSYSSPAVCRRLFCVFPTLTSTRYLRRCSTDSES